MVRHFDVIASEMETKLIVPFKKKNVKK